MALGCAPVCVGGAKKESPATLYLPISERDCCGPFGWHEGQDSCFFLYRLDDLGVGTILFLYISLLAG